VLRRRWAFFVLAVLCLLIVARVSADEADHVDLPIEFYFGRWVPGHLFHGYAESRYWTEPGASSEYSYTSTKFKLGLSRIQDVILFSDNGTLFSTSSLSGYWRPILNLQIGIDSLDFYRLQTHDLYSESIFNNPGEELIGRSTDCLAGQASISWSNRCTVRLPARLSKLMYVSSTLVGQGTLLIRGRSLRRSVKQDEQWRDEGDTTTTIERDTLLWQQRIEGFWGVRENLNLLCSLALQSNPTSGNTTITASSPGTAPLFTREHEERDRSFNYSLRAVYAPAEDLFVEIGWTRAFASEHSEVVQESMVHDPPGMRPESTRSVTHQDGWSKGVSIKVDYLTTGQFTSALVLDDYQGYYRHMLSRGQTRVTSAVAGSWWTNTLDDTGKSIRIDTKAEVALSGRCQLDANLSYDWFHTSHPQSDANIGSSLSLRWRSFDYFDGASPGWKNDFLLDAALGPLLAPNDMYASVTFSPPNYQAGEFTGDGAFDARKFRYYEDARLSLELVRGLLSGAEIALSGETSIRFSDRGVSHAGRSVFGFVSYGLSGSYRLSRRFEIGASFHDLFFPDGGRVGDYAEIRGDLRGLL
jgi:hypothetical protein